MSVGLIPYWRGYDEVFDRATQKIGGKYLIEYTINILQRCTGIESVYIYSSDDRLRECLDGNKDAIFLNRPKKLNTHETTIEDIIEAFCDEVDSDIITLLHPNSPFLSSKTVDKCIEEVSKLHYASALTVQEVNKLAWYQGKPLNYESSKPTPHLYEIEPIIFEQSSLYVFNVESFLKTKHRLSGKVYFEKVNPFEGFELRSKEDCELAEVLVNAGMFDVCQ